MAKALPPAGMAASIPAAGLSEGFTHPERVLLAEEEVTEDWKPARMRVAPPDLRPLLVLLVTLGILCIVHDVWRSRDGRRSRWRYVWSRKYAQ